MPRTENVAVLMTKREKAALRSLAAEEGGLSLSAMLRRLVRQAALRCGIWQRTANSEKRNHDV